MVFLPTCPTSSPVLPFVCPLWTTIPSSTPPQTRSLGLSYAIYPSLACFSSNSSLPPLRLSPNVSSRFPSPNHESDPISYHDTGNASHCSTQLLMTDYGLICARPTNSIIIICSVMCPLLAHYERTGHSPSTGLYGVGIYTFTRRGLFSILYLNLANSMKEEDAYVFSRY